MLCPAKTLMAGKLGKEAAAVRQPKLSFERLDDRNVPATFTVANINDSGTGSLRDAIAQANAAGGADTINFATDLTGVITLTSGQIDITGSVTIDGPGADVLSVSGNDVARIFEVVGPASVRIDVTIAGLTLTNGNGDATPVGLRDGGALLATGLESLTIKDSVIQNSVGNNGGGVAAYGTDNDLVIQNSKILNNHSVGTLSSGGGVDVSGRTFQLLDSTVDGNVSSDSGAGLSIQSKNGEVTGSTISHNNASAGGGGGFEGSLNNTIIVTNSTIAENHAHGGFSGGGILAFADMAIRNSTIARNVEDSQGGTAGLNAFLGSNVTLLSTLIAENVVPGNPTFYHTDLGGDVTSLGNNFISNTDGNTNNIWQPTDILDRPSKLPPLQNNGGPTETILPEGASFANGNGANPLNLTTDQRGIGFPRSPGKTDIGAVTGAFARTAVGAPASGNAFKGNLGQTSGSGYIRALYLTILGRDAEPDGLNAFTQRLRGDSRESIVRDIWESPEHRARQVTEYYQRYLGRNPSGDDLAFWVGKIEGGESEEDVIASFLGSDEYRGRFAAPDQFAAQLYLDVLGRSPTPAELAATLADLSGGKSARDVAHTLLTSDEARGVELKELYRRQLFRIPSDSEIASYHDDFGRSDFIANVAIELGDSDEMYNLGRALFPIA